MGTIAQKLQAVVNSKNAIKTKFGLADDLPFADYAENIAGSTSFYKCDTVGDGTWTGYKAILKEEETTIEMPGTDVIVANSGDTTVDGTYHLMDPSATGTARLWKHESNEWYILWTGSMWVINGSSEYQFGGEAFFPNNGGEENPWDVTLWWGPDSSVEEMTITQVAGTTETKIIKYYDFETELTTDILTYGDGFTPEVDNVYDAEAMIKATLKQA